MSAAASRPTVVIAGVGETVTLGEDSRSIPEIVLATVEAALADASLRFADIDAVVTASVDLNDGLTASNIAVTEVVGAVMKPETRVAGDAIASLAHAACLLWSGAYQSVLVVAHGKASMARQDAIWQWALDPVLLQSLNFSFDAYAGLQAQALAAADSAAPHRWAKAAAAARDCSIADIFGSSLVADPLRLLMRAPDADGACAVVLRSQSGSPATGDTVAGAASHASSSGSARSSAGEKDAENRRDVWLSGVGYDLEAHLPGDRALTRWTGLTRAFDRALASDRAAGGIVGGTGASTGIGTDRRADENAIDIVEASCRYPHEADLFAAATGVDPGDWRVDPFVPVAVGLSRVIAATRALRAESAAGPSMAMAHGTWGPAGQAHAVALLRAEAHPTASPAASAAALAAAPSTSERIA